MSSISNPLLGGGGGGGGGETFEQTLLLGDVTGLSSGIFFSDGDGANFASSSAISFSSTINPFGIKDVFIERQAAGILEINTTLGGGGDGTLQLGILTFPAGLGAIDHIVGPSDEALVIRPGVGQAIILQEDGGQPILTIATNSLISITATTRFGDNNRVLFGGANADATMLWDTGQTNHAWQWAPGDTSNTILIVDFTHLAVDYGHANQSNPTTFWHANSATTTLWGALAHDGTDFRVTWGDGDLSLGSNGQTVRFKGTTDVTFLNGTITGGAFQGSSFSVSTGAISGFLTFTDDAPLIIGGGNAVLLDWSTAQATTHNLVLGILASDDVNGGGTLIITTSANVNKDHDRPVSSQPEIAIYSALDPDTDNGQFLALRHGRITAGTLSTDQVGTDLVIMGEDAYSQAVTNVAGANLILAPGIGRRLTEVIDYTQTLYTVTVTINGSATVLTEGTEWTNATSNSVSAGLLATAISAVSGVSAVAVAAVVHVTADIGTYSLLLAETGIGNTVTNSDDGAVRVPEGTIALPGLAGPDADSGIRLGNNRVRFSTNGTTVLDLSGSQATFSILAAWVDDKAITWGQGFDARILWDTGQTNDAWVWSPGDTSNTILIVDNTYLGVDYGHANQSNPTLFIHANSATTTFWGALAHDATDFRITWGAGDLSLGSSGQAVRIEGMLNVGSATSAVALGDLSAGDGTREFIWDASAGLATITQTASGDAVLVTGSVDGTTGIAVNNNDTGTTGTSRFVVRTNSGNFQILATNTTHSTTSIRTARQASIEAGGGFTAGLRLNVTETAPINFATTDTIRWLVSGAGHFLAFADDTYDIGAAGATRPRSIYVGTSIVVGDAALVWDTNQTNDSLLFSPGDTSNAILIVDNTHLAVDYGHANQSNPTTFWHANSAATDKFVAIQHNVTQPIFWSGSGAFRFSTDGVAADGTLQLAAIGARAQTSDAATLPLVITSMDAYSQAVTNVAGADLILAPGIGRRLTEVIDYTQTLYTVTVTVNGSATVLTEGTEWTNATSNSVSAGLLATAISAVDGVSAVAVSAVVHVQADASTYSLSLAETGIGNTVTNSVDGAVVIDHLGTATALKLGPGNAATPGLTLGVVDAGIYGVAGQSRVIISTSGVGRMDFQSGGLIDVPGIIQAGGIRITSNNSLIIGSGNDAYISGDGSTSGLVTIGTTSGDTDGTLQLAVLGARAATTDTATLPLVITSMDAYSQAASEVTGADLILAPGIGRRLTEVIDYTQTVYTITLTINGSDTVLTEGTEWTNATSNSVSAGLLATAISAVNGVSAVAVAAVVHVQADASTYSLTLSETGIGNTVTNSADGAVVIESPGFPDTVLKLGEGSVATPAITFGQPNGGVYGEPGLIGISLNGLVRFFVNSNETRFILKRTAFFTGSDISLESDVEIHFGPGLPGAGIDATFSRQGPGVLQIGKTTFANDGTLQLAALGARAQTTDTATLPLVITSMDAYSQAASEVTGANLILAPGIGRRLTEVIDYTQTTYTITLSINGSDTVLTEGTEWTNATSNSVSAGLLATAISAVNGVSAVAISAVVHVQADIDTYSLTLAESGTGNTVTNDADGVVSMDRLAMGAGSTLAPAITFGDDNSGIGSHAGADTVSIVVGGASAFLFGTTECSSDHNLRMRDDQQLIFGTGRDLYMSGDQETAVLRIGAAANTTSGTLSLAALGVRAATTDTATLPLVITSMDAYSQAVTNVAGADLILAPGIGRRLTEVIDYTQTLYTVTVTVNGSATVLTEGTEWTNATSNSVSAGLLATAISAVSGVSAVAIAAVVHVQADASTYSLTLSETGTGNTVTNSADGALVIESFTALGTSAPKIQMKKLTGTTGGTEGDLTDIAHSLGDISKILSVNVLITNGSSNRIPPVFTSTTEHEYDFFIDGTNVKVQLTAANSGAILSKAITVLLTYEE